ncbi:MAG: DUF1592 domain-containing protein [Vicinamibacterales bacterium]
MQRFIFATAGIAALLGLGLAAQSGQEGATAPATQPEFARSHQDGTLTPESQQALVNQYCATCHSDRAKAGGLSLQSAFNAQHPENNPEITEKMIRKLRAGMMPPNGARRPDEPTLDAFATSLEHRIDLVAAKNPNPGWRPFQRLNRAEYARSVRDLLGMDVDVNAFLPPDTMSDGFDNVADAQAFSPTLLEGYLRAASRIATLAVGNPNATPAEATYKVPRTESQMHHIEGTPFGTRGGLSVTHNFPADGEYSFRIMLHSIPTGQLYGSTVKGEQVEISIDGERVALLEIKNTMSESDPNGMNIYSPKVHIKAGPHNVAAAFLNRAEGPINDLIAPIEYTLADSQIGSALGVTTLPHVRDFTISGPFSVTGVSDTPSRRRIFTCRPTAPTEEADCAAEIVRRLAREAYRAPLSPEDFEGLMGFYDRGRKDGDFETGVRMALQAILASPKFVFRLEETPAGVKPGTPYRITDLDLASRLSFFLWAASPDQELVKVATAGKLKGAELDRQVERMLKDPKSQALATRFASQWLRLQDVDKIKPDALLFPSYDNRLAESMVRETELFFANLVREDRSLLEILTADYTFVNGRLAEHYGIPNVTGPDFQRVSLAGTDRRGVLGQGSILMLTSVADRTSPVQRGKYVMEVLLGSPPPPPPPNVPALDDSVGAAEGTRVLSVRERMEQHRKNPACASCHKVIDPIGLALENFDVVGQHRIKDNGVPVDSSGTLYDGSQMEGPQGLRDALLKHKDAIVLSFTESLMTYALGRRVEFYDMPTVRQIVHEAAKHDYRLSSFIKGVVASPAFQMSQYAAAETTVAANQ